MNVCPVCRWPLHSLQELKVHMEVKHMTEEQLREIIDKLVKKWLHAEALSNPEIDQLIAYIDFLEYKCAHPETIPEHEKLQSQLDAAAEVLQVFAQFHNDASVAARDGSDHVTIRVRVHAIREARRLLGGSFRDYSSLEDIPV